MRTGINPAKKVKDKHSEYFHQVIVPVYIPDDSEYFEDGLKVLNCCLNSLVKTVHDKTFITVVNNGSKGEVRSYLNKLLDENKIHEVIHTSSIGKINAVVKGQRGHNFEFITVSDADVMFLSNWQKAVYDIFNTFKKTGVVGLVPQFKLFRYMSWNVLFDKFFSTEMKFRSVDDPDEMKSFNFSISHREEYDDILFDKYLSLERNGVKAVVGSLHFVATYRRDALEHQPTNVVTELLGSTSDYHFLDKPPMIIDSWRLTTAGNYAYHLGNKHEVWMDNRINTLERFQLDEKVDFQPRSKSKRPLNYLIKAVLFKILLKRTPLMKWMVKFKGMNPIYLKK